MNVAFWAGGLGAPDQRGGLEFAQGAVLRVREVFEGRKVGLVPRCDDLADAQLTILLELVLSPLMEFQLPRG